MSKSATIGLALVVALLLIGSAWFFRARLNSDSAAGIIKSLPEPKELGSTHRHASLLVFIDEELVDLSGQEFMERDQAAHFHDRAGTVIHIHAKGVSLPYFFQTLGMRLTADCLYLAGGEKFCSGPENKLSIFVNRQLLGGEIRFYELQKGDKILVNYGDDDEVSLAIKLNSIPDLSDDLI